MKKSGIATVAIAAACTAVLTLATAPAGLAVASAALGLGRFDAGMAVGILASDNVAAAWAGCMGAASAQEGFLPCMAAWTLACALAVALAFLRVAARNPRRDVAGGVLGARPSSIARESAPAETSAGTGGARRPGRASCSDTRAGR